MKHLKSKIKIIEDSHADKTTIELLKKTIDWKCPNTTFLVTNPNQEE